MLPKDDQNQPFKNGCNYTGNCSGGIAGVAFTVIPQGLISESGY
jgi:hypothetical protein